jgi:hypothetical protein
MTVGAPRRVGRAHGEVIADRQDGDVDPLVADQAHVAEERRVAGEIEGAAAEADDHPGRNADADLLLAVPIGRGVPGRNDFHRATAEGGRAAMIEPDDVGRALRLQPAADLDGADQLRVVRLRQGDRVTDVIVVAMGEQDSVGFDVGDGDRRLRIAGDERIEGHDVAIAILQQKRRMADVGQLGHDRLLRECGSALQQVGQS